MKGNNSLITEPKSDDTYSSRNDMELAIVPHLVSDLASETKWPELNSPIKIFNSNNGILTLDTPELGKYKDHAGMEMKSSQNRAVRHFYEMQAAFVSDLIEMTSDNGKDSPNSDTSKPNSDTSKSWAVSISFACNIALLVCKLLATIVTGSLAMLASTVDSFLDISSGSVLWITSIAVRKRDIYQYPTGKARLEPIGIMIFCCLMGIATLQVISESVRTLIEGYGPNLNPPNLQIGSFALGVIITTVVLKFLLYIYCTAEFKRTKDVMVDVYRQDHLNDVYTNSVGVAAVLIASIYSYLWSVDAIFGVIISIFVMISWGSRGLEQIQMLVGLTASPLFLQKVTVIAATHASETVVLKVDTVRAYHFGPKFIVEVHIVLPQDMTVRQSHDIAEDLERKIERLEEVERSFVHIDWEYSHKPEYLRNL